MKKQLRMFCMCIFMVLTTILRAQDEIVIKTICTKKSIYDTLAYLKQFEQDKAKYIGKPFSKLLRDIKLQPKSLYTQRGYCNYDTQFWFVEKENWAKSKYKINIIWENKFYYNGEKEDSKFYNLPEVKEEYKKNIIKEIEFNYYGEFYITHRGTKKYYKKCK